MNNTDLLEKLDMIKEAVVRNPGGYWMETEYRDGEWYEFDSREDFDDNVLSLEIRLKPQRVKVEGWVDAEVIAMAKKLMWPDLAPEDRVNAVCQALLQLVKEEE